MTRNGCRIVYKYPNLVPAAAIEAAFHDLVPIAQEVPLGLKSGYLDNLYFTPTGYPVLVEVKLWKNQEARRTVAAQIVEYSKDFAALSYPALSDKIRKRRAEKAWGDNPLFEIVSQYSGNHPDEKEFVDQVSRNLRQGRFLLLILGDGVREEMESLANYLMHHSLRYSFGIVRIRLFSMPDGSVLALPDVMAKTQTIERHVTVVTVQGTGVTVSGSEPSAQLLTETRTSLSLDGFFAQMGKTSAADVSWLGKFLQSLTDLPIEPRVGSNGDTLMLRGPLGTGDTASLMYINPPYASFWGVNYGGTRKTAAGRDAIRAFCESVAELVPGASVVTSPGGDMDVKINGANIPLRLLHGLDTGLKTAMSEFLRTVNISQDDSSGGRVAIAEEEFFELLGQRDPRVPELLRSFLAKAESLMGVYTDFQGAMNLKHASPTGRQLNMATITKGGVVDTGPSTWWDRRALGQSYNEKLAKLIGGSVNEKGELRIAGKMPRLSDLLPYEQACPSAFARGCSASRGL